MLRRHVAWRYLIQKVPYLFLLSLFLPGMVAICILAPQYAFSAQATLTWKAPTANTDGTSLTDLAGYKIYYGTASGNYSQTVDVGNVTSSTVSNLSDGTTYYFAVTAYDASGIGSGYSNEVSKTTPAGQQYSVLIAKSGTGSGTVTSSAGGINCGSSCTATYNSGSVVTLTATPAGGSTFTGWSGGGCTGTGTCSLSMSGNVTVTASFAVSTVSTYTVTATAGTGGTVSPSGSVAVNRGASKTFTIAPKTGYTVSDVKVDGASVGAVTAYTFTNVTANHKIAATFGVATSSSTIPLPSAPNVFSFPAIVSPVLSTNAAQATPLGVGDVAAGGGTLSLQMALDQFAGPADIYFLIYIPSLDPNNIYQLTSSGTLQPLSKGLAPLHPYVTRPVSESIFGNIPTSTLPHGQYLFAVLVTPPGDHSLTKFYIWVTSASL